MLHVAFFGSLCLVAFILHHQFTPAILLLAPQLYTTCRGGISVGFCMEHNLWGMKIRRHEMPWTCKLFDSKKFEKMLSHIRGNAHLLLNISIQFQPPVLLGARGHLSWFTAYLQSGGSSSSSEKVGIWPQKKLGGSRSKNLESRFPRKVSWDSTIKKGNVEPFWQSIWWDINVKHIWKAALMMRLRNQGVKRRSSLETGDLTMLCSINKGVS